MIEWILFDLDNTLIDYDAGEEQAFDQTFLALGFQGDMEDLRRHYRGINAELWAALEAGRIDSHSLKTERFRILARERVLSYDAQEVGEKYLENLAQQHQLMEGAIDVCSYLSGKYHLAVITNGFERAQRHRLEAAALTGFFEKVFISEVIGHHKPSPEIFSHVLEVLGAQDPRSVLIIGDSLASDIRGGRDAGIMTCWLNRDGAQNQGEIIPDRQIASLTELKEWL